MVIGKIQVIPMEKQIDPSPENCKKELMEILQLKSTITEMKQSLD